MPHINVKIPSKVDHEYVIFDATRVSLRRDLRRVEISVDSDHFRGSYDGALKFSFISGGRVSLQIPESST